MLNFIPILSAGRSGTNKLSDMFSAVKNVYSEHEGEPGFHTVRLSSTRIKNKFVKDKISQYESTGMQNIVHTGHMMGLGFLEKIASSVQINDCIVAQRPWREIATSMFLLDWIPYKQKFIVPWYSGPNETGVLSYDGYEKAHPYQLCYWWCLESDRRIKEQITMLQNKGVNIHYVNIIELLSLENFNFLLSNLKLDSVKEIDTSVVNDTELLSRHISFTRTTPPDSYLDMLEEEVHAKTSYMGN